MQYKITLWIEALQQCVVTTLSAAPGDDAQAIKESAAMSAEEAWKSPVKVVKVEVINDEMRS